MADVTLLETLLTLERATLDRWCRGDMGGYTGALPEQATYFDHVTPQLLRGLPAISRHMAGFEGKISIPRHEADRPRFYRLPSSCVSWCTR